MNYTVSLNTFDPAAHSTESVNSSRPSQDDGMLHYRQEKVRASLSPHLAFTLGVSYTKVRTKTTYLTPL